MEDTRATLQQIMSEIATVKLEICKLRRAILGNTLRTAALYDDTGELLTLQEVVALAQKRGIPLEEIKQELIPGQVIFSATESRYMPDLVEDWLDFIESYFEIDTQEPGGKHLFFE